MTEETRIQRENEKVIAELKNIPEEIKGALDEELTFAGEAIRTAIIMNLQRGKKSGRVYLFRGAHPGEKADRYFKAPQGHFYPAVKRNKPHQASAPGESPATDTGELVSRIVSLAQSGGVEVGALAGKNKVPLWLEEGTRFMAARPYIEPAIKETENEIENNIAKAIGNILS